MQKKVSTKQSKASKIQMKRSGITLIALVVTIVILLILAGISITVLFGDSGLIKTAKEAAERTNEAVKDEIEYINTLNDWLNGKDSGEDDEEKQENFGITEKFGIAVIDANNIKVLSNCVLGIYNDAACTTLVKEVTVEKGAYGSNEDLEIGKYYVKFKTPAAGYLHNETTMEYEIKEKAQNIWTIKVPRLAIYDINTSSWTVQYANSAGNNDRVPTNINIENSGQEQQEGITVMAYILAEYDASTDTYTTNDGMGITFDFNTITDKNELNSKLENLRQNIIEMPPICTDIRKSNN